MLPGFIIQHFEKIISHASKRVLFHIPTSIFVLLSWVNKDDFKGIKRILWKQNRFQIKRDANLLFYFCAFRLSLIWISKVHLSENDHRNMGSCSWIQSISLAIREMQRKIPTIRNCLNLSECLLPQRQKVTISARIWTKDNAITLS